MIEDKKTKQYLESIKTVSTSTNTSNNVTPIKTSNILNSPETNQVSGSTCSLPIIKPKDMISIEDQNRANSTLNTIPTKEK